MKTKARVKSVTRGPEAITDMELRDRTGDLLGEPDYWVVELEPGVWLAKGNGYPPRTRKLKSAGRYTTRRGASIALGMARRFRKFPDAKIYSPSELAGFCRMTLEWR